MAAKDGKSVNEVRSGSAPNFCPPAQEGITLDLSDENGDTLTLEFLGFVMMADHTYGFFFPVDAENPALSSGEVVILEVTDTDDDGEPSSFELVDDEHTALAAYDEFKRATKDLYRFE